MTPLPIGRLARSLAALVLAFAAAPSAAADDPFAVHARVPAVAAGATASASVAEARCGEPRGVALYAFPAVPREGGTLRFVAVSATARDATLVVDDPSGHRVASSGAALGGPPWSWVVEVPLAEAGTWRARLAVAGDAAACTQAEVASQGPLPRARDASTLWPVERAWDRDTEDLYSAWVQKLFDDPLEASPSWTSLHAVTRDPARNFLHDALGLGEDSEAGIALEPDCADLPYFLRAYFAWKMRLPFVYSKCWSPGPGRPPACAETKSNLEPAPAGKETLATLQRFFSRSVADTAHSATGRTAAADDRTDLYPVHLGVDTLRPGTVYIDPYGHVLVVVRRIPQSPSASGLLLAVDAQPDGTVARKRYWRGNFLFARNPDGSAPGFKRFRPAAIAGSGLRTLDNAEVLAHPAYGDWSTEQYEGDADAFYDKVDAVLSPSRRSARQVLLELVDSLEQQVRQRVASVQGGEAYMIRSDAVVPMPAGAAIFQTVGPWEDYATPSRDLRLLVALDVVRAFPDMVRRRPRAFVADFGPGGPDALLAEELAARRFEYLRSDGSPWSLSLADLASRAEAIEMGYNPNDCVEARWGAPRQSEEAMTCRRRAPEAQAALMREAREWFRTRTRPAT